MKSKEEIEKYLGIKIESSYEEQNIDSGYAMSPDMIRYVSKYQQYYTVNVKVLSKESEKALTDLLKDSMEKGDLETASTCHSILMEESTYYKVHPHPNVTGLDFEQGAILSKYEEQQKAREEEQARIKAEQEAKAREEEQARIKAEEKINSEEVDYLIEEIKNNNYSAWYGKSVLEIDTEIKNKVKTIENKIKELQESIEEPEKQRKIELLNARIEMLEDTWEIYTQGFDSANSFNMRNSDTNMFRNYRTNYISISKSFELFEKFQNGEEVPELFGKHHRERLEREKEARIRTEKQESNMLEQEYGLVGIEDSQTLQRRLEEIVSKGIFLGADKDNDKKVAEFEKMKQVIPRFEEFKNVYLQLRVAGIEDDLYANMDFQNVSFDDLIERATTILEEKAKAETQRTEIEQPETIIEEQPEVVTIPEQVIEETIEDEPSIETDTMEYITPTETSTVIDSDSKSGIEAHLEYMRNHQTEQTSQVVEDYWNEIHSQQAKIYEQQQPEKIRPREKSIKDEVGDELRRAEQQTQKKDNPSVDLWMNRFNGWYSAIDRVSQNVKDKFVKMKSDIVKAISEKLKERTNHRQVNTQDQDPNER